ncbi:amino acid ABC transporter permease [Streptomyces sp. NPDC005356]|uniref:amino acid ABC transporter permease n=1 Tax=Streptomyces sp. NPDC005356 TaxID=3157167 RepID=UPI0033AC0D35
MKTTAVQKPQSPALRELPDKVAERPRIDQAIGWIVLVAFVAWVVWLFVDNDNIELPVVSEYLFNGNVMHGLVNTLLLAVCAEIIAIVLGTVVGFARMSRNPVFAMAGWLFVWLFRSTPLVVQILVWGNLALFLPRLGFGGSSVDTNSVLTPFVAGVVALSLHETAYVAEIFRSGMMAVPRTQREASSALGLGWWQMQRHVVVPQALRVMIPPAGSAFVLLLKSTSLVVVISGGDLLTETQNIASVNLRTIELLMVATIWFLAVTSIASVGQWALERRFDRQNRQLRPGRSRRSTDRRPVVSNELPGAGPAVDGAR